MNALTRIGGFGLALAVVFGIAFAVGTAAGPDQDAAERTGGREHGHEAEAGRDGDEPRTPADAADLPAGLAISQGGYTLQPDAVTWPAGQERPYTFRILGPDGRAVTAFERSHDADLHLIVVRRDLTGYQHLHPTRDSAGTWSVPLTLAAPGDYRAFADFVPSAAGPEPAGGAGTGAAAGTEAGTVAGAGTETPADTAVTLGTDIAVPGQLAPMPLPAPARTAAVAGGYTVTLRGDAPPGAESTLTLSVSRDGRPVTDLEPYLGAFGHLVALRQGDLAYLHVHPEYAHRSSAGTGGPDLAFVTRVPSAGAYRLYLDFKHEGQVRTAEFTLAAGPGAAATAPAEQRDRPPAPVPSTHGSEPHSH